MDAERRLHEDLAILEPRFADERFCTDLYRALAGARWSHEEDGRPLSLSWGHAAELVNELRERFGHAKLGLAQTGGAGEVSATVAGELGTLGWHPQARRADVDDPLHRAKEESAPQTSGVGEWQERAHAEAEGAVARRRGIG